MGDRVSPVRRGSLGAGFRELSHWKLILLLTVTTLLLGVSGAMPLRSSFAKTIAGTLAGQHFLENAPRAAPTDLLDYLREERAAVAGARDAARWAGFLGVLLQMLFVGGIVTVLRRGPFSFSDFFTPARRNFWHNLKCFLIFAVALVVLLGLWFGLTITAARRVLVEVPPATTPRIFAWCGIAAVALLLFGALSLLYDFSRAARRFSPTIGAWRAWRFAVRALRGGWLRAMGLFSFWLAAGAIAVAAGFGIVWTMPAVSRPAIALLFFLMLGVLTLRSAIRIAAWGSYIAFLENGARARLALDSITRLPPVPPVPERSVPAPWSGEPF
jgi:hypothetical protein